MDDEKLIECVRNCPCLYNKKLKDFKNREKKRRAWMEVATNMEADLSSVIRRWGNLRERYSKEIRNTRNQSGSNQWPLLENLEFLRAHIIPRPGRQSILKMECNLEANMNGEVVNEFWTSTTPDPISDLKQNSSSEEQLDFTSSNQYEPSASGTRKRRSSYAQHEEQLNFTSSNQYAPSTSSTRKRSSNYAQQDDLRSIIHEAVKEFQEICVRKTRREEFSPEISGFGKMICSAISNMKRKNQALVMRQCTEIVMQAQIDEAEEEEEGSAELSQ